MATYQELRTRSQQVRDEQNIGGNTALRVGQLLMDIVKYFYDNDAAASEYLKQHFAMVNDGTHLLNWQQSPIVILHTMGETYDDGDWSALSQGENYYRNGFIVEANGQGGGINGETPKANVLYVNLANDTLYTWNGASFDAITSGGGGNISGDDIIKNAYYSNGNLVLIIETEGGDKMVTIPVTFDASNYVPTSRTVNGKALSNNITLSQSDIPGLVAALAAKVGYSDDEWLQVKAGAMQAATAVPNTTTVNGKQLNNNIVIGMADIPGLLQAIANAGSGAVSVTTNQDGTFVIHVGSTDYTINLNHTHENMAKLIVCEESELPSTLAKDTIYAQVDDAADPTEIQSLWIAGLEFVGGGGASDEPRLISPRDGLEINFDGETSKTLLVRGKNLLEGLSLTIVGDFTVTVNGSSVSSISATDANAGVLLTLTKGSNYLSGTLRIYSSEVDVTVRLLRDISLPAGYTALNSVRVSSKVITTNIPSISSWRIKAKSMSVNPQVLICMGDSAGGQYFGVVNTSSNGMRWGLSTVVYFNNINTNDITEAQINFGADSTATIGNETITRTNVTQTNRPIDLFASSNSSHSIDGEYYFNGLVYEVECLSGGSFHAYPAKRSSDNAVGLYDIENNTFYTGGFLEGE